jgi:hypothetical protein
VAVFYVISRCLIDAEIRQNKKCRNIVRHFLWCCETVESYFIAVDVLLFSAQPWPAFPPDRVRSVSASDRVSFACHDDFALAMFHALNDQVCAFFYRHRIVFFQAAAAAAFPAAL